MVELRGHDSPEREEIANLLLRGLAGDILDVDGGRHDELGM
jgi:hypothetical protein